MYNIRVTYDSTHSDHTCNNFELTDDLLVLVGENLEDVVGIINLRKVIDVKLEKIGEVH